MDEKIYTAVQGDTWDRVARDFLGDEIYMRELMEENGKYTDRLVFEGGEKLIIPEMEDEEGDIWDEDIT